MYTQTLSHTHLQRLINIASPFSPSNNKFTTNLLKQDESESIILPPKHLQILTGNSQSVPVFFFLLFLSFARSFILVFMEVGVEFCGFVSGAVPNEIVGGFNQQIEKLFNFICISDTRNFHGNQREQCRA